MKGKRILITGGTGSLGQKLTEKLCSENEVVIYSRNEERQYLMSQTFGSASNIRYYIGDVRDTVTLKNALLGCDIAIHAAAMKDLIMCEAQASQTVFNNINGSISFINAVNEVGSIEKCLAVSTDKAASPSNVYGCTKYIMEKLFEEASQFSDKQYSSVRFGNMIDSKGSLITYWKQNPHLDIKLTHPDVSRFFFTLNEAADTVLTALEKAKNGDIYIKEMKAAKIIDLLSIIFNKNKFEIMGLSPGEKIHEDLLSFTEINRCFYSDGFFVIKPDTVNPKPPKIHNTENAKYFSINELRAMVSNLS